MKLPHLPAKRRALTFAAVFAIELLVLAVMAWPHATRTPRLPAAHEATVPDELARRPVLEKIVSRLGELPPVRLEPESHPLWALPKVEERAAVVEAPAPQVTHSLNVVVAGADGGYAVIDGHVVRRGSRLPDGSLIQRIEPGVVTLVQPGGGVRRLRVSNQFTEQP